MDAERWSRLSAWHNTWLAADRDERDRLRGKLALEQPELLVHADELLAGSASLEGFLEVPAFVVAAQDLAAETRTLTAGTVIGPYRVGELLAHGGMGDVYRATDPRLGRDVALKVLAHTTHQDPRRVERFEQEARITASLDHPNIVKVHDVGTYEGRPYLVAELLVGQTLRSRLWQGSMAPAEACRIAGDLARGLAEAHSAGLVHCDLKPENVFLTRAGATKILDFGIARLAEPDVPSRGAATFTGVLLGTAGYLAPEQIQGMSVDGRTDLFTLGSTLFEMLTGQRAFARDTTIDTLYAIVHEPPPDILSSRTDLPPGLGPVVARLLEKTPEARFQSAADLAWVLDGLDTLPSRALAGTRAIGAAPPSRIRTLPWIGAIALAALLSAWARGPVAPPPPEDATRFDWPLPDGVTLGSEPAVSPDGRRIVFVGVDDSGGRLFVRDLESLEAAPIPGTEGAKQPFWSPDGDAVGFFARGRLMKASLKGGAPVDIASAPDARGGAWSRAGVIVFQPFFTDQGLAQVPVSGGEVRPATLLDLTSDDINHKWPVFLPDGVHFLYLVVSVDETRRGIYLGSVTGPPSRPTTPLFRSDSNALFVRPPGWETGALMSVSDGRIQLRPFDAQRRTIRGDPRTIDLPAAATTLHTAAMLGASASVLAFARKEIPQGSHVAVVDIDGRNLAIRADREIAGFPRLSPDGRHLARNRVDPLAGNSDIWIDDLGRETSLRATTSRELDLSPVWSPDGGQLAYRSGRWGRSSLSLGSADGAGVVKVLRCPGEPCLPTDWDPQGFLLVNAAGDVWRVPIGDGEAQALITGPSMERDARISPDGAWVSYVSHESGRPQVFIRSLSGATHRVAVSNGGDQPVWRRDGRELFYVSLDHELHVVAVRGSRDGSLVLGTPAKVPIPRFAARHFGTIYDVAPDARRVYFYHPGDPAKPREIGFVRDWAALLRRSAKEKGSDEGQE